MSDKPPAPRWRDDFPVDWERDHYVTRREMAKFLVLGSGLLAVANVLVAFVRPRRKAPAGPKRIASASELAPGSAKLFHYPTDEDPCILVRTPDGALAAYSQVCTHLSCAVVYRPEADPSESLFCPCHHGCFDAASGRATAGPPQRPLPRIRVIQDGDDIVATREDV